ncbi:hypothetical protein G3580_17595 [Nitrogeniibacter mangrovi]|uniref:DUF4398 domain-containing protein n=1 Tax=Nitrogeniibacter mangrovi TaxID=2016596 RepID=A0A6C1B6C0_9RHOO|nr:hypothetical protein [Nitrogeniibacter mangrovi]QID19272.1 hypothetical protein G3580_17595 [Nitrogeniibacter mangrovi]
MAFPLRSLCLTTCLAASFGTLAQQDSSAELRAQAKAIRDAAEATYRQTSYHCYDKFLVNACLEDAKLVHINQVKEARRLEARANRIDRGKRIKAMEARLRKVENRPEAATVTPVASPTTPAPRPADTEQ